jgi:hypothetical protein
MTVIEQGSDADGRDVSRMDRRRGRIAIRTADNAVGANLRRPVRAFVSNWAQRRNVHCRPAAFTLSSTALNSSANA